MNRRFAFWLQLVVPAALALVLAFNVTSLFGGDVGAYIQAMSTIVLVTVTISYVAATHTMARTADMQFSLQRDQRAIDAATELWNTYCELAPSKDQVVADIRRMWHHATTNVNNFPGDSNQRRARTQTLKEFSTAVTRLQIHLDEGVTTAALALASEFDRLARIADQLDSQILQEMVDGSTRDPSGFVVEHVVEVWGVLSEVVYDDLPSWGELGQFSLPPETARVERAFKNAVTVQVQHRGDGAPREK